MRLFGQVLLVAVLAISIVGCADMTNEDMGTITGGVLGAALGSQFGKGSGQAVGVAVGAIAGGFLGNRIGRTMDQADKQRTVQVIDQGQPNHTYSWTNPDSGYAYQVTPGPVVQHSHHRQCREFTQNVMIGGKEQQAYGTACRQPDGSWKIENRGQ